MTTNPAPHLFWITSRAAGFSALILASLAVSLGLLMSTKLLKRRGPDLLATHEVLSLSAIAAILVHGLALLGDGFLHPSLADISIPFVSGYKTIWTSLGIISGWSLVVLGLAYYGRRRIGAARWRKLHRFTALAWLLGLAHSLGEGTDAGQVWFLAMLAMVTVPALALLALRMGRTQGRGGRQGTPAHRDAARGIPARDLPARDLPAADLPARDLPAADLPPRDLPRRGASGELPARGVVPAPPRVMPHRAT